MIIYFFKVILSLINIHNNSAKTLSSSNSQTIRDVSNFGKCSYLNCTLNLKLARLVISKCLFRALYTFTFSRYLCLANWFILISTRKLDRDYPIDYKISK